VAAVEVLSPPDGYQPIQGSNLSLKVENVWKLWKA
jgi:hypothetical protein